MRNIILVALLIALATVFGCKEKAAPPAENTMNSMDTQTMESTEKQSMDSMETESKEKEKKEMVSQSPETMEAPAAASETPEATETPESGDAAGTPQ